MVSFWIIISLFLILFIFTTIEIIRIIKKTDFEKEHNKWINKDLYKGK